MEFKYSTFLNSMEKYPFLELEFAEKWCDKGDEERLWYLRSRPNAPQRPQPFFCELTQPHNRIPADMLNLHYWLVAFLGNYQRDLYKRAKM